jgi:hypothetical protein
MAWKAFLKSKNKKKSLIPTVEELKDRQKNFGENWQNMHEEE